MPYKEKEIEKKYYSIGEVAKKFGVATSLIRFWESEFDVINPRKNKKGNRKFTGEDVESIRQVYHLVKEKGYKLQGAKEILKKDGGKAKEMHNYIESLQNVRQFLVQMKEQL